MTRTLLAVPVALLALLTGCSNDDGDTATEQETTSAADPGKDAEDTAEEPAEEPAGETVSAAGLSFSAPEGWQEVDAEELADGSAKDESVQEFSDRMGVTPEQFEQMMKGIDLYLFSDEGATQGFLENINVTRAPGAMPNDSQLEMQYLAVGGTVSSVEHPKTDLGEVTVVAYELPVQGRTVAGQTLVTETDEGVVAVTVSSLAADSSAAVMRDVVATLAAD